MLSLMVFRMIRGSWFSSMGLSVGSMWTCDIKISWGSWIWLVLMGGEGMVGEGTRSGGLGLGGRSGRVDPPRSCHSFADEVWVSR
jgi:hypothetical protein